MKILISFIQLLLLSLLVTGCSSTSKIKQKPIPTTHFVPASFSVLDGWSNDTHEKAFTAFVGSCKKINNKKSMSGERVGENLTQWKKVCKSALHLSKSLGDLRSLKGSNLGKARRLIRHFFEKHFMPYKIGMSNRGRNLTFNSRFTGYYEIELHGTKKKHRKFPHPIYTSPANLHKVKGSQKLKRASINNGSLHKHGLEIAWVNDMPRLYFMHIQGAGVVKLKEGGEMPLVWCGTNGYSFKALPNEYLGSSIYAMNRLRMNGKRGLQDMNSNDSYIFFKQRREMHPVGAQNVMLTPERSAAIDSRIYPYGVPIWIETKMPNIKGYVNGEKYRRLLIAQDRGGAIKGGGRLDLFFGRGKRAENVASGLNVIGNMYVLFPKSIRMPKTFDPK